MRRTQQRRNLLLLQGVLNPARMGWLDSIFGAGSGSGSFEHRRYGENEYYEYPRYPSGLSHSGGSGSYQGGSSSDSWRAPNIFEVVTPASHYPLDPIVPFMVMTSWMRNQYRTGNCSCVVLIPDTCQM